MSNPKDKAAKNKTPLHLVPLSFMRGVAEALATGAAKYGAWNWRMNHITASTYISACERHLRAWQEGQELDEESKLHPLKHAAATLAVLIDAIEHKSWIDDRPTVRGDKTKRVQNGLAFRIPPVHTGSLGENCSRDRSYENKINPCVNNGAQAFSVELRSTKDRTK